MNYKEAFLFTPRNYKDIALFKDVTDEEWNDPAWQKRNAIRTIDQLSQVIRLTDHQRSEISRTIDVLRSQGKEPLRITPYYASLMQEYPFNPVFAEGEKDSMRLDPIFWQSVPTPANLLFQDTGKEGLMEEGSRSYGAAYQRYPNRVALFVAENTSCASYCIHCQRAKSLDSTVSVTTREIDKGLFYISANGNIDEVLVTGGDALMVSTKQLQYVLEELSRIKHLRVIRIATRVPVVLPMAVTDSLLRLIKRSSNKYNPGLEKYVYFMTHVNHYQEITAEFAAAVKRIRDNGFTIRNQTVLLNHVNDYFKTLGETFRRMFWVGVHPYYLLQCHKEKGIVHFISPVQIGKIYMKALQGWISGITKPVYAANVEGGGGKVMLMPSGHDTLNTAVGIDDRISASYATVSTWDDRKIPYYEALGRASREEYDAAVEIMDRFIGRSGVFLPKIIITDKDGRHIETTNRTKLPHIKKQKKAMLLGYEVGSDNMPITNPAEKEEVLDKYFERSRFSRRTKRPMT